MRKPGENKLSSFGFSPSAPKFRKVRESAYGVIDGERDSTSSSPAAVFTDVIANVSEIANGGFRPADEHQPG
jgi:hypothetical protein